LIARSPQYGYWAAFNLKKEECRHTDMSMACFLVGASQGNLIGIPAPFPMIPDADRQRVTAARHASGRAET